MSKKKNTPLAHGPMKGVGDKANDFKGSIKRLIKELDSYKTSIIISLSLAVLGAILSIVSPNRLRDLTNEITKGLIVDTNNTEKLTKEVMLNINSDSTKKTITNILKEENDSTYKGQLIKKEEKIKLQKTLLNLNNRNFKDIEIPNSVKQILLEEIKIDGIKISSEDQINYILISSKISKDMDSKKIYKQLDKMPNSVKKVIDPKINMSKIKQITLLLICLYVLSALFTYIEQIIMTIVSNKFAKRLRKTISRKINKLPLKYFDKHKSGDILSRVTNDVDMIASTMNHSLATLVSSVTLFFGTIIMMFITNYIMAITAIVSTLFGFIFMAVILSKSQKYFVKKQESLGNLNGHIEEIYSSLNVVKVYNGTEESKKKFNELNEELYDSNMKSQFLSGLMMPLMGFIGNFGYVMVCIVGALLTMNDVISFGVIVAFMAYVRLFTSPLSQIGQAFTQLQATAAASERVFEFLDEEELENESSYKVLNKKDVKGTIEFKNISFTYDGNQKPTIHNFSAIAKPGKKVAIVGPTGAGKTTLVNLLMKFYEINDGDILIDNISIKELSRENIHELFTMVLQDTWVFDGTIKENIIFNKENVSDSDIYKVCKEVGVDHYIKTLSKGYDSNIKDNDSISAGQRQLLTIARGMLEDAPFLILDEATSNVDTRTEELVATAMDKLTKGKTSFIIAHRLSTIKNADLILVMKDGNIIEQGTHDSLIEKNGFYAELYNSQFKLL